MEQSKTKHKRLSLDALDSPLQFLHRPILLVMRRTALDVAVAGPQALPRPHPTTRPSSHKRPRLRMSTLELFNAFRPTARFAHALSLAAGLGVTTTRRTLWFSLYAHKSPKRLSLYLVQSNSLS